MIKLHQKRCSFDIIRFFDILNQSNITQFFICSENEKLLMLLPLGYPSEDATVPQLERKPLLDFAVFHD